MCPHGNERTTCERCNRESKEVSSVKVDHLSQQLRAYLTGNADRAGRTAEDRASVPRGPEAAAILVESLRQAREGAGRSREGGLPDFAEAVHYHELANDRFGTRLSFVEKLAQDRLKKPFFELTREQVGDFSREFPEAEILLADERQSLASYQKSEREFWEIDSIGVVDGKILRNGLEYRMAEAITDKVEREAALDELDEGMAEIISSLSNLFAKEREENGAGNEGKIAECQLMLLIRHWARRANLDHVIGIEHTLLRDDFERGIDLILRVGSKQYYLDQKTTVESSSTSAYTGGIIESAGKKAAKVGGRVLPIDTIDLQKAYREYRDGLMERSRIRVVERVAEAIDPEDGRRIMALCPNLDKASKAESPVSPKALSAVFMVGDMVKYGILAAADARNMKAIETVRVEASRLARDMANREGEALSMDVVSTPEKRRALAEKTLEEMPDVVGGRLNVNLDEFSARR